MILHRALAAVAGPDRIHGSVAGRDTRLLLDAGLVDANDVAARLSRRLSIAAPARESRRLAGWPALRRRDAAVVDLTDELDDPVDVLFGVQLGGGTDINRALAYCQDQIARPAETILVLISDLYEGGIAEEMLRRAATIVGSGTTMIALLALSDSGHPSFDSDHALPWPESASWPSPACRTCSRI